MSPAGAINWKRWKARRVERERARYSWFYLTSIDPKCLRRLEPQASEYIWSDGDNDLVTQIASKSCWPIPMLRRQYTTLTVDVAQRCDTLIVFGIVFKRLIQQYMLLGIALICWWWSFGSALRWSYVMLCWAPSWRIIHQWFTLSHWQYMF